MVNIYADKEVKKYQTEHEMLLSIVLDKAIEDLQLSDTRKEQLFKKGYMEEYEIECVINKEYHTYVGKVKDLLMYHTSSSSDCKRDIHLIAYSESGSKWTEIYSAEEK